MGNKAALPLPTIMIRSIEAPDPYGYNMGAQLELASSP